MDVLNLLKQIIAIPSYYDGQTTEGAYARYIISFLQQRTSLRIVTQSVVGSRSNIIVHDGYPTRLLFACHLDTTSPKAGVYKPLHPTVVADRLYGLGAKDMKGGAASLLAALTEVGETKGLALLFYVDEEGELRGMRRFIEQPGFPTPFKPRLIVSPESQFVISHGNRGIISLEGVVHGRSAHSARPHLGLNAIMIAVRAYQELAEAVSRLQHPALGTSVATLTYLVGGSVGESVSGVGSVVPLRRLNSVPDIAEFGVNVRTAVADLDAAYVECQLRSAVEAQGAILELGRVVHDYQAVYVDRVRLGPLVQAVVAAGLEPQYGSPWDSGYNEVAMAAVRFGVPYANFGPAGGNNHAADEYVLIPTLEPTRQVFCSLIKQLCGP